MRTAERQAADTNIRHVSTSAKVHVSQTTWQTMETGVKYNTEVSQIKVGEELVLEKYFVQVATTLSILMNVIKCWLIICLNMHRLIQTQFS